MNIIYMSYNNYYNRIVKKEATVSGYFAAAGTYCSELYDVNFNPNDGVMTEHVMTWTNLDWTPDYAVVYNDQPVQYEEPIKSRWFVLEWVRTRNGQYKATLYRDVVADNLEYLLTSPMYIEKAKVPNETDVAIYNKEILETNQIKTREFKLKDKSQSAWLVGYFAKNINWGTGEGQLSPVITTPGTGYPGAITTNTLAAWSWSNYIDNDYKKANAVDVILHMSLDPEFLGVNAAGSVSTDGTVTVYNKGDGGYTMWCTNVSTGSGRATWITNNIGPDWIGKASIRTYVMQQLGYDTQDITALHGQTLFVESGTDAGYYDIEVIKKGDFHDGNYFTARSSEETYLGGLITCPDATYPSSRGNQACVQRDIDYTAYRIKLTKKDSIGTTFTWPTTARTLNDAPYGMFCMPAKDIYVVKTGATTWKTVTENEELNIACTIAERLDGFCYDLQKLPFCPLHNITLYAPFDGAVSLNGLTEGIDYAYIVDGSTNKKSIIFFCDVSSGTFKLDRVFEKTTNSQGTEVEVSVAVDNAISIPHYVIDEHDCDYVERAKITNQCDFYRMYSPNWSASFEFNLVKTGTFHTFDIDYTYKPYCPYIHINPDWARLYGKDYNDYRGLIAQGDFSVPRINDQWQNYMINNKNYLNAFNRQIDNLEFTQGIERKMQVFNAITGTITSGINGATTAAKMSGGNPYAMIAGAAVGTTMGAVGGALDVKYGDLTRNETLNYKNDMFNYDLQNIQARPDTLGKVSTYDENNAVFPVIEYYTCTFQEKEALYNKMKYNGMTIMRIGKLEDFINEEKQYIKGKLIRNETIIDDYHIMTAIAEELDKGVFM